ncbi:islet amyloid polypeptide [Heterocephalus glaber]|uniref:Islet amyloid polypeptide n=1 Tax=Heterocephalus glaber TaxID=10181 RepID=A0A0P6J1R0_HETGA|nr:islet amyloid polypeptide [Heterocephalus glaber]XP_021114780.1 islet amyloid polypeptide [Heterocephalus glaber]
MSLLRLPVALLVLSVALKELKATPIASDTSHQVDKRKCNTATCTIQRLTNFLVRSSHNLGAVLLPTDVGSNTYGKRNAAEVLDRELLHYLPL